MFGIRDHAVEVTHDVLIEQLLCVVLFAPKSLIHDPVDDRASLAAVHRNRGHFYPPLEGDTSIRA